MTTADSPAAASEQVACPAEVAAEPAPARRPDADRADGVDGDRLAARAGPPPASIGGVILFPAEGTDPDALGAEIAKLRRAAQRAAVPAPLVAIDQEGGDVERLPSLPPSRSATAIGARGARPRPRPRARRPARRCGARHRRRPRPGPRRRRAGDWVIASRASPQIRRGRRARDRLRGRPPGRWRRGDREALPRARGRASTNTDVEPSADRARRRAARARARAVRGGDRRRASTWSWSPTPPTPALDPSRPASQSRAVIDGLLRERLGL